MFRSPLRPENSTKKMYSQFLSPLGRVLMLVRLIPCVLNTPNASASAPGFECDDGVNVNRLPGPPLCFSINTSFPRTKSRISFSTLPNHEKSRLVRALVLDISCQNIEAIYLCSQRAAHGSTRTRRIARYQCRGRRRRGLVHPVDAFEIRAQESFTLAPCLWVTMQGRDMTQILQWLCRASWIRDRGRRCHGAGTRRCRRR